MSMTGYGYNSNLVLILNVEQGTWLGQMTIKGHKIDFCCKLGREIFALLQFSLCASKIRKRERPISLVSNSIKASLPEVKDEGRKDE